jgi:hypothetical protein
VKRSRGRGRRPQNNHNRSFDSTGPDIKIRGTAAHVYEKYLQLARDASSAGDRVTAENYLQHAEHYYRILMAQGGLPQQQQQGGQQQNYGGQHGQQQQQPYGNGEGRPPPMQEGYPQPVGSAPSFSLSDADEGEEGDEAA